MSKHGTTAKIAELVKSTNVNEIDHDAIEKFVSILENNRDSN